MYVNGSCRQFYYVMSIDFRLMRLLNDRKTIWFVCYLLRQKQTKNRVARKSYTMILVNINQANITHSIQNVSSFLLASIFMVILFAKHSLFQYA